MSQQAALCVHKCNLLAAILLREAHAEHAFIIYGANTHMLTHTQAAQKAIFHGILKAFENLNLIGISRIHLIECGV